MHFGGYLKIFDKVWKIEFFDPELKTRAANKPDQSR